MCGIAACTVTKFVQGRGSGAVVGGRIDLAHPAAVEYLREKTAPRPEEPVPGVDPLFEKALESCYSTGRWTGSSIMRKLSIGYERACRILDQLRSAGHVPAEQQQAPRPAGPTGTSPPPPPPPPPRKRGKPRKSSWDDESTLIEAPDDVDALGDLTLRELIDKFGTEYRFLDWLKSLKEIEAVNEKRIKNAQSRKQLVSRALVETAVLDPIDGVFVKLLTDAVTTISSRAVAIVKADGTDSEVRAMVEDQLGSFIRPVKDRMRRAIPREEN